MCGSTQVCKETDNSFCITYFVHEWYPEFSEPALLKYPKQAAVVAAINKQINQLAPVLNSATVANGAKVTSSKTTVPIAHMVKRHGGSVFVFAVAMRKDTTRGTFVVVGLPAKAVATVLGEDREIAVGNGTFQDDFKAYGVHLYRINPATDLKLWRKITRGEVAKQLGTEDFRNL